MFYLSDEMLYVSDEMLNVSYSRITGSKADEIE